jgi:hypothetical protein
LTNALFTYSATAALNCPRPIIMSEICGSAQAAGALGRPPGVTLLPTSFYRTHFIPPWTQGGSPSTSSTSVVSAVGPCCQHPQGARHRRLQLRWWPLSDLPPAPPRGPAIDVFNFGGGRCQTLPLAPPKRARHRCVQLRWWPLLDLAASTP